MSKKVITCGKCGKTSTAGSAHNARTCGKKQAPHNVVRSAEQPLPQIGTKKTKPSVGDSYKAFSEHGTLTGTHAPQLGKRMRTDWVVSAGGAGKSRVFRVDSKTGVRRFLNEEELQKYNCVTHQGSEVWFNSQGYVHRSGGPAIKWADGTQEWWLEGEHHREGGPAVKTKNGTEEWWAHGERHRVGGPAITHENGTEEWWAHGERHRVGGPAVKGWDRTQSWYLNGELHREDGPATEMVDGTKFWYLNGELHRVDGPAVEYPDGTKEWWVDSVETHNRDLCEKATRTELTDDEFHELCNHDDYVVRQVAAANPQCPPEWRTLAELKGL